MVCHFAVFQLRDILAFLELGHISSQNHVCMATERLNQFRHINIALETVGYLESTCAVLFQARLHLSEGSRKFIESTDAIILKDLRSDKTHHGPYFGHGVGDRCSRCQNHVTATILFLYVRNFQIQAVGTFTVAGIYTLHVLHLGSEAYLLVVVRFINEEGIHAHLLEGKHVVRTSVKLLRFTYNGRFLLLGLVLYALAALL